jgi:erythronate-4-phosphate dehydrogenase
MLSQNAQSCQTLSGSVSLGAGCEEGLTRGVGAGIRMLMRIVCSTNMPLVEEAFGTLGDSVVREGRRICAADVRDADLLAVRSTTRVDRALLEGSRVRFVGTATIGTDHLDIPYLEQAGIAWCYAPGCNANSVSEYITAALLCLARRHGFTLAGRTVGIVGIGNVGRRVVRKMAALGLNVLMSDPPRERAGDGGPYVPLERILAESDIVTVHVPLTREGADRTWHLADAGFFARMKPGSIFLDAARGAVVDTDALIAALTSGRVRHALLDTWEGEPAYRRDIQERVDLATPHIAGHSYEGKVMGTVQVYREACKFLGVPAAWSHEPLMPAPLLPLVSVEAGGRPDEAVLWDVVRQVYDIEADDRRFRQTAVAEDAERRLHFDRLRKDYPERREFPCTTVMLKNGNPRLAATFEGLGFTVTRPG